MSNADNIFHAFILNKNYLVKLNRILYYTFTESEDLSSGDFSEPTTPNRKNFLQNENDEVFQHYQLLVLKLDSEFKNKQSEFERSSANNRSRLPLTDSQETIMIVLISGPSYI